MLDKQIPCLSIRQPQAELMARGLKTVEYRNWTTWYRGDFYIHSPLQVDNRHEDIIIMETLPKQAIIGKAYLYDIKPSQRSDFLYEFHIINPVRFNEPILNVMGNVRFFYLK
jgi:ASCH domain-containing protein